MHAASGDRRLLVVSYHFPPDPAVGGLRWSGLTKYLSAYGWQSWVVTAAPQPVSCPPGVTVASRPRLPTLNDAYRRLMGRLRRDRPSSSATPAVASSAAPVAASTGGPARQSWLARLRLEASVLLSLPDHARGWVLRAAWTTRRLIAQVRPTAIVSSGPPHSAHIAAWLATRFTDTPWYVDLRDPWAGPTTEAWRNGVSRRSVLARRLASALERLAFGSATGIICNTREFASALAVQYPMVRIAWVPNAVDHELVPTVDAEPFAGLGIVHAGSIYGGRDLAPVLQALRMLFDRHPGAAHDGTCLRIAGHVAEPYAGALKREIAALNLERNVDLLGSVPRVDALTLVGRSRLAVVLAQGQDFQVPAKLYEMVAMGVQTVVLASPRSAAGAEAWRLGARVIDPRNIEELVTLMEQAGRSSGARRRRPAAVDYQHVAERVSALLAAPWGRPELVAPDLRTAG